MNKNIAILLTAVGFVASFAVVAPVFAQTQAQGHLNIPNGMNFRFGCMAVSRTDLCRACLVR